MKQKLWNLSRMDLPILDLNMEPSSYKFNDSGLRPAALNHKSNLLSLSQRSPLNLWGQYFTFVAVFLLHLFIIFGVGLPAYLSNHNPFSREHIFEGFNEFPSLVNWCTVIHHHRPQGPTLFRRVRWDFTCVQCSVCTDTGPPVLSPIRED